MSGLPPYATTGQRVWYYAFRVICGLIFFFLIAPIVVIIPLSFNAQDFFTFTPEMLALKPEGYSTKHYADFFTNDAWQQALWNSVRIAPMATIAITMMYSVIPWPLFFFHERRAGVSCIFIMYNSSLAITFLERYRGTVICDHTK